MCRYSHTGTDIPGPLCIVVPFVPSLPPTCDPSKLPDNVPPSLSPTQTLSVVLVRGSWYHLPPQRSSTFELPVILLRRKLRQFIDVCLVPVLFSGLRVSLVSGRVFTTGVVVFPETPLSTGNVFFLLV